MNLKNKLHTKYLRKLTATGLAVTMLLASGVTTLANQRFVDLPASHWAYQAAMSMSDQGFMVANSAGQFRPDAPLDKFETARILANIAGFRAVGASPEQQALQVQAYENHYGFLQDMNAQWDRWTTASNHEIALLLELGVLTQNDVRNFLVLDPHGAEQFRALSRQEAAVFLTRVFGFGPIARAGVHAELFTDDLIIAPAARHYVYFLRAQNVISGDGTGAFSPSEFVTRAALSVMLYRTQNLTPPDQQTPPASPVPPIGTLPGPGTPPVPPVNLPAPVPGPVTVATPPAQATPTPAPVASVPVRLYIDRPAVYSTIQGTFVRATANDLTLRVRFLGMGDLVTQQDIVFPLALNANFFMGGLDLNPAQLTFEDVLTVRVSAGQIFEVEALEPSRAFNGILTNRLQTPLSTTLTVRDGYGAHHQLVVGPNSVLERAGSGRVEWDEIRIGDAVELTVEGQMIQSLFAFGQSVTVDGYVASMIIRADLSELVLRTNNVYTTYYITGTLSGLSNLSVGDRVRLRLDSLEIEGFSVLN